jgi:PilZ domain
MERRRRLRIPVEQLMEVRLYGEGIDTVGRVVDLNNAGAFVATDLTLAKNAKLKVELRLPGADKSLPLDALVARRTEAVEGKTKTIPAGLGLVFLTQNVMERAFIQMAVLEALKMSLESTRHRVGKAPSDEPATSEVV